MSARPAMAQRAYANTVLGILFLVYVFNFVDRQILAILIQPIKEDLGVSDTAMGLLAGPAFALFYTLAGIPIARWADRGSRRTIIALGLFVWSAMTAVCGLAQSFAQLALARVGVGVGEAAGTPPSHSLISDYFPPEQRGRALAVYGTGLHVGILLGLLAGGWINEWFGWRRAFFVVGLPGLALAAIVAMTVRDPQRGRYDAVAPPPSGASISETLRCLAGVRSLRLLLLATPLVAVSGYAIAIWAPAFLIRVHGMGTGEAGTWLGLVTVAGGATGTFSGGLLGDRLGRDDVRGYARVCAWGTLLALPFAALFLLADGRGAGLLLGLLPLLFFGALYIGPCWALIQGLAPPHMRATAAALLMFLTNLIGLGVGPFVVGLLNDVLAAPLGDEAVRYTLLLVMVVNLPAAWLFWSAARTLPADWPGATQQEE